MTQTIGQPTELLTQFDQHLFTEGRHLQLFQKLGAHPRSSGTSFALWAPHAQAVSVLGDFNEWQPQSNPLERLKPGIWYGFVPGVNAGAAYQYAITSAHQGYRTRKSDPFGFRQESWPGAKSLVWDLSYQWGDHDWMSRRRQCNSLNAPLSIYQVDLGSWRRVPEEGNRVLTYREVAPLLSEYLAQHGFTHVQLLPVMEHGRGRDLNRAVDSYFAPATLFGAPQDLMFLIDHLHQHGIGVILEWVPTHFPNDPNGLAYFDGTQLYEHGSWMAAWGEQHQDYVFDYSRGEVRSFLLSSAFFWLSQYHVDGLCVDAVDALLYLDYGRNPGEWIPNEHGGRENLEGISFARQLNEEIYRYFPDVQTFADERGAWPLVSRPTYDGGLGFGFKLDNGFRKRTLQYFRHDPFFRKFHHDDLTFREPYAASENLVLPLADEEVGPGQGSLLARMPGDEWQRLANLRLLFGYLFLQPGKKLIFMGNEFAQWHEWNPEASLDWHLCQFPYHNSMQRWIGDLNHCYRTEAALHQGDSASTGFEWIEANDAQQSTLSWLRRDPQRREVLLAACNFTPAVRFNFRVGVRRAGRWREILNSDARHYGGSGQGNFGRASTVPFSSHGLPFTLIVTLPPLAIVLFKHEGTS